MKVNLLVAGYFFPFLAKFCQVIAPGQLSRVARFLQPRRKSDRLCSNTRTQPLRPAAARPAENAGTLHAPRRGCGAPAPGGRRGRRAAEVTSAGGAHTWAPGRPRRRGVAARRARWRARAGARGPWVCCAPSTRASSRAGRRSARAASGRCTRCAMSTGRRGSPSSARPACTSTTGQPPGRGRWGGRRGRDPGAWIPGVLLSTWVVSGALGGTTERPARCELPAVSAPLAGPEGRGGQGGELPPASLSTRGPRLRLLQGTSRGRVCWKRCEAPSGVTWLRVKPRIFRALDPRPSEARPARRGPAWALRSAPGLEKLPCGDLGFVS